MKKLLAVAALVAGLAIPAHAQIDFSHHDPTVREAQNVADVVRSTMTCSLVAIDHAAGTDVIVSTTAGYTFAEVLNLDGTQKVFCSENSAVATSGGHAGWKLNVWGSFGSFKRFLLAPSSRLYCINDGAGSVNAEVCRGR